MSSLSSGNPPAGGDEQKRAAARESVERYVRDGMVLGLGSGSTSLWMVRRLGELISGGELAGLRGVPTSETTASLAREVGIPLVSLAEERPDLVIDGADEISPALDAVKGLGGALLREKIVASSSRGGLVIIADESKKVDVLGECPVPVEVEPFGCEATLEALSALGCDPELRLDGALPFVTDGGHYTVDCRFPSIPDPAALEREIKEIPGALECGLFVGMVLGSVVARETGVEVTER
jgi:ribose 5-phosphate isomerase A